MKEDSLEQLFADYLQSKLATNTAWEIGRALARTDLFFDEGAALQAYLRDGPDSTYVWQRPPWTGSRCRAGTTPPAPAHFGDLWLDTVELRTAILVPNTPDVSKDSIAWVSLRPVHVWQFRTFARLMRRGRRRTEFPFPEDYLNPARWGEMSSQALITNIYHDEALGYAVWFGKFPTSHGELCNAQTFLPPAAFQEILPRDLKLWHGVVDLEWERDAYGQESLDKIPRDDVPDSVGPDGQPGPDRIVFAEWERHPNIGFSTALSAHPRIDRTKPSFTEHFDLQNSALNLPGA